jgi:predicted RNase H-like nuclease
METTKDETGAVVKFIGIDGCRLGWFYVGLDEDGNFSVGVIRSIHEITSEERLCDLSARQMIKPRGSTVFPAPARSAISKDTYEEGSEENYRRLGRKLSKQSWAITGKIKEVDDFMRAAKLRSKVREFHPEVAFCGMNSGRPILTSKKKSDGFNERFDLLKRFFPNARAVLQAARVNTPLKKDLQDDDILDALVGAVTASYYPVLSTIPTRPVLDDEGLPMEMLFALKD